jgi:hypothetical protein
MATKLYRVRSTKSNGTEIIWIGFRNDPPVRYAKAMKGLSADLEATGRQRQSVDELFTYEEARQWLDYLERHYRDLHSKIVEVDLPLAPDAEALSYTSGDRQLLKPNKAGYPFSSHFEVRGYEVQQS